MKNFLFLMLLFFAFACDCGPSAMEKINAEQTESMLKNDQSIQLIDLRTPAEIAETGIIEGAKNINFTGEGFEGKIGQLDKCKPVLLYCAAGSRSAQAASELKNMGFAKVFDYAGGMSDWKAKGKKTAAQ